MTEEENKAIDLLKFYEGFFKNIGHEEEVKSIESIINYIEKLKKENEELKNKVVKRDKELIKLEEYANKNFERKDDVKAKYIPKDKIREKIKELEEFGTSETINNKFEIIEKHYICQDEIDVLEELLEEE